MGNKCYHGHRCCQAASPERSIRHGTFYDRSPVCRQHATNTPVIATARLTTTVTMVTTVTMDLAARLRACRTMVPGLSARELGALADLPSPTVSNIERADPARPNEKIAARTLLALARVLGTTVEYLVDGEGETPDPAEVNAAVARARAGKPTTDAA